MQMTAAKVDKDKALRLMNAQLKMSNIYSEVQMLTFGSPNPSKEQDLIREVRSLRDDWLLVKPSEELFPPDSFLALENVCIGSVASTPQGSEFLDAFFKAFTEAVFFALNKWLHIYIYIYEDEEFAGQLLDFCAKAPRISGSTAFFINLIPKLRFSSEQRKFEFLMNAVEKYPDIFMREDLPHPNYIYKPSAQRTFEKCPICGGTGEPYHCAFSYRLNNFDYPFQPFKLWMQCGSCKNLYSEQFPEDFLALSTHQKEIVPGEDHQAAVSDIANVYKLAIWSDILNKLRKYTDKKALLEVGIGSGELLSVALEMGYDANAVEIVEESAQKVSDILGIPIHCGDFLNFKPDKTFSIIIMGDVIEHVTNPEAALRNAYDLLDDDGVLWLSTPNFESSFTRLKKFTDPMWLEPYHITYFNYSGLEALLKKCGFEVKEYSVSNRYNGSMELIITKK